MQNEFKTYGCNTEENPDQSSVDRWVWDLEELKDKIETLGKTIN